MRYIHYAHHKKIHLNSTPAYGWQLWKTYNSSYWTLDVYFKRHTFVFIFDGWH